MANFFDHSKLGLEQPSLFELLTHILKTTTEYAMIGLNLKGIILLWNQGAKKIFLYEPEQVIGKMNIASLFPKENQKKYPEEIIRTALEKGIYEGIQDQITKNNKQFSAKMSMTPILNQAGAPIALLAYIKNITQEDELKFYTRSLIEADIDALAVVDPLGVITDVNKQMEVLTGYTREELINTSCKNYVTEPGRAEEGIKSVLEDGRISNFEITIKAKDGHETMVSFNAATFFDIHGKLQGIFASARDISDFKNVEKKLRKTLHDLESVNKELRQFSHIAAHELQEPLRMISSFTQLLEKKYKNRLTKEADDYIHYAVDGALRLQSLLDDLLIYTSMAIYKDHFVEIDVNALMKEVLVDFKDAIESRHVKINLDPMPVIKNDPIRFKLLLHHIISNAIKFNDKEPIIHIGVADKNDKWQFSVSDNGIGIERQYFKKLFIIFQRLNANKKYHGNGLGLAICKKIVEQQDGTIWLESELGKGTTFFFTVAKHLK